MKKTIVSLLSVFALSQIGFSSVTINIGLGQMFSGTSTSSLAFPVGGRINFLALESGNWTNTVSIFQNLTDSFVPSGAVLLGSVFNDDSGGPGVTGGQIIFNFSGGLGAGDQMIAVAYPTLTSLSTSPGQGTPGFFFRTDSVIDGSDIAWVVPNDGVNVQLFAYTSGLGGSVPNDQFTSGDLATGGSGFTTVPEPSTYALMALGGLVLFFIARRRKTQQA